MSSNVTNLDELVGEDHEFVYRGDTYKIPGDPATENVFEFLSLYDQLLDAQKETAASGDGFAGTRERVEKLYGTIAAKLLLLFQERDPELKKLPFGFKGTQEVLKVTLGLLGVTVTDRSNVPPAPAPPAPKRKKSVARATSVKKAPKKKAAARR